MDMELIKECLPQLIDGTFITLKLVGITMVAGLVLAIPLALIRNAKSKLLSLPAFLYIYFFRGTPLLVQLFIIYYGFSQFEWIRDSIFWVFLQDSYWCSVIAFTLNTTAYAGEIIRGAILSVHKGQVEAAVSLGMTRFQIYKRIIGPQASLIAIPGYSNELVLMMKGTSLASTVALLEITGITRNLIAETFMPVELFFIAGCIYMLLSAGFIFVLSLLEKRMSRFRTVASA
ncbi:MAG: ABC transporter permease [Desulfobacter sp.]|nr:ABC transporter permease [Desulfobacter sp.]WDP84394.1 MAG: ABC transporter permease [Desulfobacter sp.]